MIYKDKDLSEIEGILQVFPSSFEDNTGTKLDMRLVEKYLNELLEQRELELIKSSLDHLSPRSIKLMLSVMKQSELTMKQSELTMKHNNKQSNNFEPVANKIEPMDLNENDSQLAKKKGKFTKSKGLSLPKG